MIGSAVPVYLLQSHRRMCDIEHLKLPILVAGREDQVAAMTPSQAVAQLELRLRVDNGIVPPAVLHDDGGELPVRVEDV